VSRYWRASFPANFSQHRFKQDAFPGSPESEIWPVSNDLGCMIIWWCIRCRSIAIQRNSKPRANVVDFDRQKLRMVSLGTAPSKASMLGLPGSLSMNQGHRYRILAFPQVVDKRWTGPLVVATVVNHFVAVFGLFCSAHFSPKLGGFLEIEGRFSSLFLHFLKSRAACGSRKYVVFPSKLEA